MAWSDIIIRNHLRHEIHDCYAASEIEVIDQYLDQFRDDYGLEPPAPPDEPTIPWAELQATRRRGELWGLRHWQQERLDADARELAWATGPGRRNGTELAEILARQERSRLGYAAAVAKAEAAVAALEPARKPAGKQRQQVLF